MGAILQFPLNANLSPPLASSTVHINLYLQVLSTEQIVQHMVDTIADVNNVIQVNLYIWPPQNNIWLS